MHIGEDTCTSADAQRVIKKRKKKKKETPQIWELELQTVACWMLEIEFKFSVRAVLALNHS